MPKLKTAVIGAGAFGRNHLRVLAELAQSGHEVTLAAVVDANPATAQAAAEKYAIPAFTSVEELLAADLGVDAAAVAVPTIHHAATAAKLLAAGIDLLIEKPLAANLEEADRILALAKEHGRIVQPGHLE